MLPAPATQPVYHDAQTQGTRRRPYYLQLHFDTLYSPEIRRLCPKWRCALIDIMAYAVRSDEPGVITIPTATLANLIGFRKYECFQQLLDTLEDRRIIAYRKDDDAIVLNPSVIPQIPPDAPGDIFPRRRKPSDRPEAVRSRVQRHRQQSFRMDDAPAPADQAPTQKEHTDGAADPLPEASECNAPVTPGLLYNNNRKQESRAEQQPPEPRYNTAPAPEEKAVVVASSAAPPSQSSNLEALQRAGVSPGVAAQLVREHDPEAIANQLAYLPFRKDTNRAGQHIERAAQLVTAIRERWPEPQRFSEDREAKQKQASRHKQQEIDRAAAAQRKADREAAAAAVAAKRAQLSEQELADLRARAIATLTPEEKKLVADRPDSIATQAMIEAAEAALLASHKDAASADQPAGKEGAR